MPNRPDLSYGLLTVRGGEKTAKPIAMMRAGPALSGRPQLQTKTLWREAAIFLGASARNPASVAKQAWPTLRRSFRARRNRIRVARRHRHRFHNRRRVSA